MRLMPRPLRMNLGPMNILPLSRLPHQLWLVLLLLLAIFHPVEAQFSQIQKAANGTQSPKTEAPEKPEDVRKRLELWLQEARDSHARLENPGSSSALPVGITPAELDERRRDLEQMVLITISSIKGLNARTDAGKALDSTLTEAADWAGFAEPPPYSIIMIDELLNERDATKAKLISHQSSLSNFERLLASMVSEIKPAEEAVSTRILDVENAAPEALEAAKWRLEAARLRSRLMAIRAGYLQTSCESLKDRVEATKAELALVERKIRTAQTKVRFNEEDLVKIEKITNERKETIQKELSALPKRLKTAFSARSQAQSALDALLANTTEGKESDNVQLARFRLEVAEVRIESLQAMTESLESLIQLENITWKAYQDRHIIMNTSNPEEREKTIESLVVVTDRLGAWVNVVAGELTTCGADLSKIESRAASISADDPRFDLINEQRAARSETLALLQRVNQAVNAQRKLLQRWIDDFKPDAEDKGVLAKASSLATTAWKKARETWSYEVMSFDDSYTTADGVVIPKKVSVKLGMLLRALLFFIIGYYIASRVANHMQRKLVIKGFIPDAQAKTLRNWAMIAVGVGLALGTLSFLHIPLTVFAFFGGALAIGLGFGMQTLIKNFISGIIVLAERKVRVGDILDVDGIIGTVIEVNTRSSIIRSADDVETMIPNSLFLENRVSNWTLSSPKMRRNLRVGVAYGSDPRVVMDILTESAGRHGMICKDPAPFAVFDDFGESALAFNLYFWVDMRGSSNALIISSDLRLMIDKRFTETGIGVPFPQRDMHLTTDSPIQVQISNSSRKSTSPYE
jgi:small-conductance mechanosensitive channel